MTFVIERGQPCMACARGQDHPEVVGTTHVPELVLLEDKSLVFSG